MKLANLQFGEVERKTIQDRQTSCIEQDSNTMKKQENIEVIEACTSEEIQ